MIGFVGSFAPWHGLSSLIQSFKSLVEQGADVHLLLVGHIGEYGQSQLKELADPAYQARLTITGFVDMNEVPSYLKLMDIATLPNTEDYCSPLKLFEYMAAKRAIVTVATDAVTQVLRHEREGLSFRRDDKSGLIKQLQRLVDDPLLRQTLAENAYQRVTQHYSWADNAKQVMSFIDTVLERERE